MVYTYGCKVDVPDIRDFKAVFMSAATNPTGKTNNRAHAPAVIDQGQLGSCTANALANAFKFLLIKDNVAGEKFLPSRLFIYYNERALEGTVNSDAGAVIRDGFKVINTLGACAEHNWDYEISKYAVKPPATAYTNALHRKCTKYMRLTNSLGDIKGCCDSGYPLTIGFAVYDSFESQQVANTGIAPMPVLGETMLGGHCVNIWDYDDSRQVVICQNSWGTDWGDAGWFTLPYAYVTNPQLTFDLWTARYVARAS